MTVHVAVCFLFLGWLGPVIAGPAIAPYHPCTSTPLESGQVDAVLSALELKLSDGRVLRLAEVGVLDLSGAGRDALQSLLTGKTVQFSRAIKKPDRHKRIVAHVFVGDDSTWLQQALLRGGTHYVDTTVDQRRCAGELLAFEADARTGRRGIWARGGGMRVLSASEAVAMGAGYMIAEGKVLNVANVRGTTYMNFGENWRTDLTLTIRKRAVKNLISEGVDIVALEGHRVRVRGFAVSRNGPQIQLTHKEQIELLDGPALAGPQAP